MCIRFGMVSMETDVEELLGLVIRTGLELEDQVHKLQSMSEMVRKGIEDAQNELRKESDEMIWQEGILRHVPLVGSIYNWLSPAQKLQMKGRTLSLNEGKLLTSDVLIQSNSTKESNQVEEAMEMKPVAPNTENEVPKETEP